MKRVPIFNFTFRNASTDVAELYIDGEIVDASEQAFWKEWIGDDGSVSFKSMREQINACSASTINIYINSPGGLVTEAMAIHDLIVDQKSKGKTVNTFGRGIVASAATYILMAGHSSSMSANSWFMIHNVSSVAMGDVNDMENQVKTVRKINNTIRDFYANATGLPAETISSMMNKETWLTGSEAHEKGFVGAVTSDVEFSNAIQPERWMFNNTEVLAAYNSAVGSPENSSPINSNADMKKLLEAIENGFKNLGEKLGVKNNAEATNALTDLQNSLTTAVKEDLASIPDETKIGEMITNALNGMEALPEKVITNLSEAVTNAVTTALEPRLKAVEDTAKNLVEEAANTAGQESNPKNDDAEVPWGVGIKKTIV